MRRGQPSTNNIDSSRVFVLRLRTVLDENGNIKSANYGKIYGDFLGTLTHYFNPTKNDQSLEFDRKRNLLGGVSTEFP